MSEASQSTEAHTTTMTNSPPACETTKPAGRGNTASTEDRKCTPKAKRKRCKGEEGKEERPATKTLEEQQNELGPRRKRRRNEVKEWILTPTSRTTCTHAAMSTLSRVRERLDRAI